MENKKHISKPAKVNKDGKIRKLRNENQVIRNIKENKNRDAELMKIVERYKPVTMSLINRYNAVLSDFQIDRNDLFQEASIGYYIAAMDYNFYNETHAQYLTFAYTIVRRRIFAYVNKHSRIYSREIISTSEDRQAWESSPNYVTTRMEDNPSANFQYNYLREKAENYYKTLDEESQKILYLKYQGKSYDEIADELGIKKKRVDNVLHKLRGDYECMFEIEHKKRGKH